MKRPGNRAGTRAVLAILVALPACTAPGKTTDDGVSAVQFQDIPVPEGLTLRERFHASDSRVAGDYRYANFTYGGTLPVAEVGTYLLERMPQHSWRLEDDHQRSDGTRTLSFRRGDEVVNCSLSRRSDATTVMEIQVRTTAAPPQDQR
ncbi:MAG: hypothetical protein AAF628_06500 [Planctomycetota bacterium]